jgi:hypothetical protein
MKLTPSDILKIRGALIAARTAGINSVVITNGYVAGVHEKHIAAIFSALALDLDPAISIGLAKLTDLEKRLSLFGEIEVEGEVNANQKMCKLAIRGKGGKIDYRCSDERLITYPKSNSDEPGIVVTISKPEIALLSKGAKTLSAEHLTLQVKRDGTVHFECHDTNQDEFQTDLEAQAEFVDEVYPYVNPFDVSSGGVFLALLEHMVKDADTAQLVVMKTGNISLQVHGHEVFAVPRIQHGE